MPMPNYNRLKHFSAWEFNKPEMMDKSFLELLDAAREEAGIPFVVNHVRQFRDDATGAHSTGHAVDIRCRDSRSRFIIVTAALKVGFTRIGIYDKHIHLDNAPNQPPRVVWHGVSQ
jgi:zinc D-Ala-D-Ala carboxypeptidase